MKYLNTDIIKKQLNIDDYFTDDDIYLEALGETAEDIVEKQVNEDLCDIAARNNGILPPALKHAMKMLVEYLYNNRGSDDTKIPDAFYDMIKLYRNYR